MTDKKHFPKWLQWAREIQALAQNGLAYAENEFDQQRYQRLNGISAEIISQHINLSAPEIIKNFDDQMGYATPKVDVRGAVFKGTQLLMVKEKADGTWAMPGGWADVGDLPSAGVEREILEETGITAKAVKLIGAYDANRLGDLRLHHAYKLMFFCEFIVGEPCLSNETVDVRYFDRADIPEDLLGTRTSVRQIDDAYTCMTDPSIATIFD